MEFQRLGIPDVVLVVPHRFEDSRGWLAETYSAAHFSGFGIGNTFLQDNHSFSRKAGTVRALHFQHPPHAQAKLVRAVSGSVYDVAVDLRRNSPTFGNFAAATLTAQGGEQLFIPAGFAHGFCTLEPDTGIIYKVDRIYAPESEDGIIWSDPELSIPWPIGHDEAILSDRDKKLGRFRDLKNRF